jgi:hypothetical protein
MERQIARVRTNEREVKKTAHDGWDDHRLTRLLCVFVFFDNRKEEEVVQGKDQGEG